MIYYTNRPKRSVDKMNHTKSDIIDAFWQLLEEKPYNKITVKDIAERCQINRNTFYYHFHDIPELLEYIIKKDADYIIQNYSKSGIGSPSDCIIPLVQYITKRKKAALHIYRSVQREVFQDQLERIALYVVNQYVDTVTAELSFPPEDKKLLIRFYKCTLVGLTLDWMNEGMSYNLLEGFMRTCDLLDGLIIQSFLKVAKSKHK